MRKKERDSYHHGHLAESLLDAVDEMALKFGLEAVTLRGCAKRVGVSPSSAFRHYADKRALMTAFATRAMHRLTETLAGARRAAFEGGEDPFAAVSLAYVRFAIERPAYFRAMWREELIYSGDEAYVREEERLQSQLTSGFAGTIEDHDPEGLSPRELLAWSAVHGLASLIVDGPVGNGESRERQLRRARSMIAVLSPVFGRAPDGGTA